VRTINLSWDLLDQMRLDSAKHSAVSESQKVLKHGICSHVCRVFMPSLYAMPPRLKIVIWTS
jgi:hypothetical protein